VRAKVYLLWNGQTIYAAYDVTTDTPWKSAVTARDLSFQGGAAVDLNFGPEDGPGGANRKAPAAGDMRVVASPGQGISLTVFEPVPASTAVAAAPATYQTGQGTVTFASVFGDSTFFEGPHLMAPGDPDAGGGTTSGYIVMFALPRNPLIPLQPGQRFRLDASVILSNGTGDHAIARLPWHSTDPGDKTTEDTYTEALLRPANWGTAVLE